MLPLMLLRSRIGKPAKGGISEADTRNAVSQAVQPLERRIESLELACASMWELLKTKIDVSDEDLLKLMNDLDGKEEAISIDEEVQSDETCPSCGRTVLTRRGPRCLWCGAELPRTPFGG